MLVARQILRHLIECPAAVDTAAGIQQWWLSAGQQLTNQSELEGILEVMVAQGWLIRTAVGSSSKLYGVNGQRFEEIWAFLNKTAR
jgi:hypothetical protein